MKVPWAIACFLGLSGFGLAEEVKLRNGGTLKGTTRQEGEKVLIDTGLGTITLAANEVEAILPDSVEPCQDPLEESRSGPKGALPSVKPENPQGARVLEKDPPRPVLIRRRHPEPEISPGYRVFGIPPSVPPRGSQNHGGYGGSASLALPTPVRGLIMIP
jgi:hypothetical protein